MKTLNFHPNEKPFGTQFPKKCLLNTYALIVLLKFSSLYNMGHIYVTKSCVVCKNKYEYFLSECLPQIYLTPTMSLLSQNQSETLLKHRFRNAEDASTYYN